VMAANIAALRARQRDSHALRRYEEIARILTGKPAADAEDGMRWVQALTGELRIPPLGAYGVTEADVPVLVEKTAVASSTKANPIALTRDELTEILFRAL
jgi:alcohol dehydrogenase class IV